MPSKSSYQTEVPKQKGASDRECDRQYPEADLAKSVLLSLPAVGDHHEAKRDGKSTRYVENVQKRTHDDAFQKRNNDFHAAVSSFHFAETYYWTDEANAIDHVLPHVFIVDRRTPDTVLEAMAARGPLYVAIAFAVVAGLIGLAGSVGLERVERSTVIAARV